MSSDPLLSALVAKLPASDAEWPVERQLAWLNLMAMAFGVTYGGDAAARIGIKSSSAEGKVAEHMERLPTTVLIPVSAPKPKPVMHKFIIDMDGNVCTAKGKPVLPGEVNDVICDLRGPDGDIRAIAWADGSTGVQGWDLTITA